MKPLPVDLLYVYHMTLKLCPHSLPQTYKHTCIYIHIHTRFHHILKTDQLTNAFLCHFEVCHVP